MITIAIPLYNTEKYIQRCLDSVLSQTFRNIEILVINDCCTDHSIEIVKSIIQKNNTPIQIRILNQEKNQGVALARNRAIQEAKGEFVYFLDSDDKITPNCIELLQNTIVKTHSNFVMGSYCYYNENTPNDKKNAIHEYGSILSNKDFFKYKYAYTKNALFTIYIWNTLFDITFLRNHQLKFKPLRKGEDHIFFLELMPYITSCVILPDVTYHYILRGDSLSNYKTRNSIPAKEVEDSVHNLECEMKIVLEWKNNYYFPEIIYQQIRDAIWMLLSIIRKKSIIEPYFPHESIRFLCKHPLSFKQILTLKRKRMFHITFYIFSCFPLFLQEFLVEQYMKRNRTN